MSTASSGVGARPPTAFVRATPSALRHLNQPVAPRVPNPIEQINQDKTFTDIDIADIKTTLNNNPSWTAIKMDKCTFAAFDAVDIFKAFVAHPNLKEVSFPNCTFLDKSVRDNCLKTLVASNKFEKLELNNVKLGEEVAEVLISHLPNNSMLKVLDIQNNQLKIGTCARIVKAIGKSFLEGLDLSGNRLADGTESSVIAENLGEALKQNRNFKKLALREMCNSYNCMHILISVLKTNSSLTHLDLSYNELIPRGHSGDVMAVMMLEKLTIALNTNSNLKELVLHKAGLPEASVTQLQDIAKERNLTLHFS